MKFPITLFILATAFMASVAAADTVRLKNGGTIEGIIEKEDAKKALSYWMAHFKKDESKVDSINHIHHLKSSIKILMLL